MIEKIGNDRDVNKKKKGISRILPMFQIGSDDTRNISTVPTTNRNSSL